MKHAMRYIAGAAAVVLLLTGCASTMQDTAASPSTESTAAGITTSTPTPAPSASAPPIAESDTVTPERASAESAKTTGLLATLPIKGRAPKTGYTRAQFGQAWSDDVDVAGGHNGCDTRNDILQRDLTEVAFKSGSRCVVASGTLQDAYTARTINFVRGETTSTAVQIDHMVALSDAWQTGAQQLTLQQRTNLANDPLNLQALDGPTNAAKGDGDAATWLPPNKAYRCTYVTRQVEVKAKYHLWVTQAEHDAIVSLLSNCSGTVTPAAPRTAAAPRTTAPRTTAPAKPVQAPTTKVANTPNTSVTYANCTAARAAGVTPIYRGQPGYSSKLDRDGDGIACE